MIAYCRSGRLHRHKVCSLKLLGFVGLFLLLFGCSGEQDGERANEPHAPQGTAPETQDLDTRVFPPASFPFGQSYGGWSAEWWQWAFSIPASENPLLDETGEKCATAQRGPVWFLAGVTRIRGVNTRHCAVPEGTALFLPALTVEKDNSGVAPPRTEPELRALARADLDGVTELLVELDGVPIRPLQLLRFTSPVFSITLPPRHLLQMAGHTAAVPGTVFPVVAEGVYVMLKPLPVGEHTLAIRGRSPDVAFTLDLTYRLSIIPLPPVTP
jgi:hypothetical protein